MRQTHEGVLYEKDRAFGTDYHVHILDTETVRMKIVHGFNAVPTATHAHGAQLGFNNVGWGSHKKGPGVPNDLLWIGGKAVQHDPIHFRRFYSVNVLQSGEVKFDTLLRKPYNVIGFDRIIGKAGDFNKLVTDVSRAPRTVYAKDMSGRLVILTCEGRQVNQLGLTFKECWEILRDGYVVTDAGNADGGGSTCAMNTALSDDSLIEYYKEGRRRVVAQTLFYATPVSDPSIPVKSLGARLTDDAVRLKDAQLLNNVTELEYRFPQVFE